MPGRILDNPTFSGTIQFTTGSFTASAGTTVDLSASTLKLPANCLTAAMLPLMSGDTGQGAGGASGAVPAPPLGSAAGGMFLSAGGQWAVPAANLPAGTALVLSPMTTAGDMIVGGANGAATRLPAPAANTAGTQTLQWTSAGGISWGVAAAGGGGGIADAPSNGVLYGRENGGWVEVPAGGGGTLAGLSDVDETTAPANGQALVYSVAEEKWKPGTVAASGGGGGGSGAGGAVVQLAHVSDGDANGLFYFLGQTRDGTWANPQTLGMSGVGFYTFPPGLGQNNGSVGDLTSRSNSGLYLNQADPNGIEIDIGPNRALTPTNVTLTNRSGYDGTALQAVNLYGSQDGVNFTLLGNLPVALNLQNSSATCPVPAQGKAFRYFRLLRNGANNAGTEYFCIGQVEMYGTLYVGGATVAGNGISAAGSCLVQYCDFRQSRAAYCPDLLGKQHAFYTGAIALSADGATTDGVSSYIDGNDGPTGLRRWTAAIRFRTTSAAGGGPNYYDNPSIWNIALNNTGGDGGVSLVGGVLNWWQAWLGSDANGATSVTLNDGAWHTVAIVCDQSAGTVTIYSDGASVYTSAAGGTVGAYGKINSGLAATNPHPYLGACNGGDFSSNTLPGSFLAATFGQLCVWSVALTPAGIASLDLTSQSTILGAAAL